jgi:NifU-like protein involved in Fe-S cluster formation
VSRNVSEEEQRLMAESGYSKKAIELYVNNVNMGTLQNPTITTPFLGPCGDLIELYLKIDKNDIIEDAKFYYLGCPGSAASASAMTILVKGKTLDQAKQMTEKDILIELDGLPHSKLDCAKLSIKTLRKAITEYKLIRSRLGT